MTNNDAIGIGFSELEIDHLLDLILENKQYGPKCGEGTFDEYSQRSKNIERKLTIAYMEITGLTEEELKNKWAGNII